MVRTLSAMTMACAAAAVGQILLRHGLQQVGPLESWGPMALASFLWRAMSNASVVGGTVLNAVFYVLFLVVLSWSEVTVALPLTALERGDPQGGGARAALGRDHPRDRRGRPDRAE